jgi:hypothetical protein
MQPSTVSRILPIVAEMLNLDPVRKRQAILDEIFACESLMFSGLGSPLRQAFFVRRGCVPIETYTHDCRHRCRGKYFGFSLPVDVEKAEVFRLEGQRITMASQFSGPAGRWGCRDYACPTGMDLGQGWSLPVDPPSPGELGFKLRSGGEKVAPVMVGVSYYDLNGTLRREDVEANGDAITFTSRTVSVLEMNGITLPPGRCHYLEVWCGNSHVLAEFHPSIDVPNFRRFAINDPGCAAVVEYEDGLHVPMRPLFDSDRVETGDPNFWRNLIQWKDLHFKTKRSPSEERSYGSTGQFLVGQASQMLEIREPESLEVIIDPLLQHRGAVRNFRNLQRRHFPLR